MVSMGFRAEKDVAAAVAVQAGQLIQLHAGRLRQSEVWEKGVHDLVTAADVEVQAFIVERLRRAFPDYGFLAEEGEGAGSFEVTGRGCRWIIDPIDGTTNFTHGMPPYAVSIALQCKDELVVGVVYDVVRQELFAACQGEGLYVNGVRRGVSTRRCLEESLVATGFPYKEFAYVDTYLEVLKVFMHRTQGVRRPGAAAIDLAYLASGRVDGFFEAGLSAWDVAAGVCLIQEAGGKVSDFHGGDQYLFGRQIVASNGVIHKEMLRTVQPLARILPL